MIALQYLIERNWHFKWDFESRRWSGIHQISTNQNRELEMPTNMNGFFSIAADKSKALLIWVEKKFLVVQFSLTFIKYLVTGILVRKVKLFLSWRFLKLIFPSWSLAIWFLKPSWFLSWRFLKSSLTVLHF